MPPFALWEKSRLLKVWKNERDAGALQIEYKAALTRSLALQGFGWEWSGTTAREGSTVDTMRAPTSSHAGAVWS